MVFRDTSQKHCMKQWNGSSGLLTARNLLVMEGGEVGGGRESPQLRKGSDVTITHLCARVCCFQYLKTGGYPV